MTIDNAITAMKGLPDEADDFEFSTVTMGMGDYSQTRVTLQVNSSVEDGYSVSVSGPVASLHAIVSAAIASAHQYAAEVRAAKKAAG